MCPNRVYDTDTKETVWGSIKSKTEGGTGGGYSNVFPKPSYQNSAIPSNQTRRGVPDVAGDADPSTGWSIYLDGQYQVIGGTSAVAPMWAAY